MKVAAEIPRSPSGLTPQEAELQISALEAEAAKILASLTETIKHEKNVGKRSEAVISCIELLFDELNLEGLKHNQFVEDSINRTKKVLAELREALISQRNK